MNFLLVFALLSPIFCLSLPSCEWKHKGRYYDLSPLKRPDLDYKVIVTEDINITLNVCTPLAQPTCPSPSAVCNSTSDPVSLGSFLQLRFEALDGPFQKRVGLKIVYSGGFQGK